MEFHILLHNYLPLECFGDGIPILLHDYLPLRCLVAEISYIAPRLPPFKMICGWNFVYCSTTTSLLNVLEMEFNILLPDYHPMKFVGLEFHILLNNYLPLGCFEDEIWYIAPRLPPFKMFLGMEFPILTFYNKKNNHVKKSLKITVS